MSSSTVAIVTAAVIAFGAMAGRLAPALAGSAPLWVVTALRVIAAVLPTWSQRCGRR